MTAYRVLDIASKVAVICSSIAYIVVSWRRRWR